MDAGAHPAAADGCRLAEAETFSYRHGDPEHLEWGLLQAQGRGSLIVTEGLFGAGDLAPLEAIVELARRHDARLLVDESHALGAVGQDGRGAAAAAGVADEVDVTVGSLATALGSYGGYLTCDRALARYLAGAARTFTHSTAPGRRPWPGPWPRWGCCARSRAGSRSCGATPPRCAPRWRARGSHRCRATRTSWPSTPAPRRPAARWWTGSSRRGCS